MTTISAKAFRVLPGQDLKSELQAFCFQNKISAATVVSGVGSLRKVCLRLANGNDTSEQSGFFEIVSMTGTLSEAGLHLHLAVADEKGVCFGGHLMPGCLVYTTAEIVLLNLADLQFSRVLDSATGYPELHIQKKI